jgi:hypothetical protein
LANVVLILFRLVLLLLAFLLERSRDDHQKVDLTCRHNHASYMFSQNRRKLILQSYTVVAPLTAFAPIVTIYSLAVVTFYARIRLLHNFLLKFQSKK